MNVSQVHAEADAAKTPIADKHDMPFGATVQSDGSIMFKLWAPSSESVELILENDGTQTAHSMSRSQSGWFSLTTDQIKENGLYRFRVDGNVLVPDPASRFQPKDVHGPSQVINPDAFVWTDQQWQGRPWHEAVIYELHVGTFSEKGTFEGVIEKLDELKALGITAIELMPLADFAGVRGWGYDGVLPFAPDSSYGSTDDLKRLVDTAHEKGLMVFLDVVYNHFGPDGNYLHCYAKQFFTDKHSTPWGAAIDFESQTTVREFYIDNAIYWLKEYHFDGLRMDAIHAIKDDSAKHIINELTQRVHETFAGQRKVHIVLENDDNIADFLNRDHGGNPVFATAQWNDDIHHAYHVIATDENEGYYEAYRSEKTGTSAIEYLGIALAEGFIYQGQPAITREGGTRGQPSKHLPPTAFVSFIQNHDQIGNRAFGDRLSDLADPKPLQTLTSIFLLSPQIPLLFMGEEWASTSPFFYFCDFEGELGRLVTNGRRKEFERFSAFQDPKQQAKIPDPCGESTFARSKLVWKEKDTGHHKEWHSLYLQLLKIRHEKIVPLLTSIGGNAGSYNISKKTLLQVKWLTGRGGTISFIANLGNDAIEQAAFADGFLTKDLIFQSDENVVKNLEAKNLDPWALAWFVTHEAK